jgi:hypothetical protein
MIESSSTGSPNTYEGSDGYVPHWEEFQSAYDRPRNTIRAAVFGSLSGGIFFFGLAAAILSGHFWPVFLVALALTSLVGSLSSSNIQAIYGGFQGCVFFLGLAVCSVIGWWPWILAVFGIAAILGIGNGLLAPWPFITPGMIADQYYTAIRNQDYAQAYTFLDAKLTTSLTQEQFSTLARSRDVADGPVSKYTIAPDLDITTIPLPGEPLPLVTPVGNPSQKVTVTVMRAHGTSYPVHLQMRRAGKGWKITAFDRI